MRQGAGSKKVRLVLQKSESPAGSVVAAVCLSRKLLSNFGISQNLCAIGTRMEDTKGAREHTHTRTYTRCRSVSALEKSASSSFFTEWKRRSQRKAVSSPTLSIALTRFLSPPLPHSASQLSCSLLLGKYEKCWKNKTLSRTKHATRPENSWADVCCCSRLALSFPLTPHSPHSLPFSLSVSLSLY